MRVAERSNVIVTVVVAAVVVPWHHHKRVCTDNQSNTFHANAMRTQHSGQERSTRRQRRISHLHRAASDNTHDGRLTLCQIHATAIDTGSKPAEGASNTHVHTDANTTATGNPTHQVRSSCRGPDAGSQRAPARPGSFRQCRIRRRQFRCACPRSTTVTRRRQWQRRQRARQPCQPFPQSAGRLSCAMLKVMAAVRNRMLESCLECVYGECLQYQSIAVHSVTLAES